MAAAAVGMGGGGERAVAWSWGGSVWGGEVVLQAGSGGGRPEERLRVELELAQQWRGGSIVPGAGRGGEALGAAEWSGEV